MKLAKALGLNVPEVHLLQGKFPYFVVDRYDRVEHPSKIVRLHQLDLCQILVSPSAK